MSYKVGIVHATALVNGATGAVTEDANIVVSLRAGVGLYQFTMGSPLAEARRHVVVSVLDTPVAFGLEAPAKGGTANDFFVDTFNTAGVAVDVSEFKVTVFAVG